MIKNLELVALKVLKTVLDKDISVDGQSNSKCLALLYQPKRILLEKSSENQK